MYFGMCTDRNLILRRIYNLHYLLVWSSSCFQHFQNSRNHFTYVFYAWEWRNMIYNVWLTCAPSEIQCYVVCTTFGIYLQGFLSMSSTFKFWGVMLHMLFISRSEEWHFTTYCWYAGPQKCHFTSCLWHSLFVYVIFFLSLTLAMFEVSFNMCFSCIRMKKWNLTQRIGSHFTKRRPCSQENPGSHEQGFQICIITLYAKSLFQTKTHVFLNRNCDLSQYAKQQRVQGYWHPTPSQGQVLPPLW